MRVVGKHLRDMAQPAPGEEFLAVAADDSDRFLAAVLQRMQPQRGHRRGFGAPITPKMPHSSRSLSPSMSRKGWVRFMGIARPLLGPWRAFGGDCARKQARSALPLSPDPPKSRRPNPHARPRLILTPFEWTIAKRYMLPGAGEAVIALVAGISLGGDARRSPRW